MSDVDPPKEETNLPVPVARSGDGLGHHNVIALSGTFVRPIISVKALKLSFRDDHGVIKDNASDWKNSGAPYREPEWTYGVASAPVSYARTQEIGVDLELEVNPPNADDVHCEISGTAAFGRLTLSGLARLRGGIVKVTVPGKKIALGSAAVAKLTGDIAWSITEWLSRKKYDAGASWGHTIFVTIGTPQSAPKFEEGLTHKRMDESIQRIAGANSDDPHTIVAHLMKLIPGYALNAHPAVPAAVGHPDYLNNDGGAWLIGDYQQYSATCIAIVRWVRAMLLHVGCPGTVEAVVVWADPDIDGGRSVQAALYPHGGLAAREKKVGNETWSAILVDGYPEVGKTYQGYDPRGPNYLGKNNYEACLRFTHGSTTKYYGGGAGVYPAEDRVIYAFYALCWAVLDVTYDEKIRAIAIKQVVRRYRDKAGNIIE